jgi:hypothetical protein
LIYRDAPQRAILERGNGSSEIFWAKELFYSQRVQKRLQKGNKKTNGVVTVSFAGFRYNDPGTLPPFRTNEVMVRVQPGWDPIWTPGELEALAEAANKEV